jgi:hypothetical protein
VALVLHQCQAARLILQQAALAKMVVGLAAKDPQGAFLAQRPQRRVSQSTESSTNAANDRPECDSVQCGTQGISLNGQCSKGFVFDLD